MLSRVIFFFNFVVLKNKLKYKPKGNNHKISEAQMENVYIPLIFGLALYFSIADDFVKNIFLFLLQNTEMVEFVQPNLIY